MNFVFLVRSFVVNLVFLVVFLSKYAGQLPENSIFDFYREALDFLTHVRELRFDFPLQNLSFIKYLDGKWGPLWALRYKSMGYFSKPEASHARFTNPAVR